MQELVETDAENALYQRDLGLAHYRLGNLALRRGDHRAADEQFGLSLEVRQSLADKDPANDRRQMELMLALAHCKQHVRAAEMAAAFRQKPEVDNELLLDVARAYAQCAAAAGEDSQAETYLQQAYAAVAAAVDEGYKDAVYLEAEVDFDPLRTHEGFQALVARLREKLVKPE
jgi:hypothetical protein